MTERSVFLAALDITDAAERQAYLDRACGGDVTLKQRVERLLRAHSPDDSFLQKPPPDLGSTTDHVTDSPGTMVGPYKLLQQIGEGGMGVVFMVEQQEPVRRRVALKLIRPGMDSTQVITRFEAERQALALMDHPNIARVLDGGTAEDGRPFFVMELVHGVPITRFCDDNHLSLRQRLELFVLVCLAVQHAHQKGIIHRDLKPGNVLVCLYDGVPVPKVIDFGVAKAVSQPLTDKTLFTQFGAIVGTLEYMSPEQAETSQLGIDTRSDVYSLGVLLYELLTGTTPLDRRRLKEAAVVEVLRLIREEEPPPPSTRLSRSAELLATLSARRNTEPSRLPNLLRGELDWIALKALEKDRGRRYDSAGAFARDVERYLNDETVEACPPSAGYRLRKALRKHRGPVLAGAAVFLALAVGVVGTTAGLLQARRSEQDALNWAADLALAKTRIEQERDEARHQTLRAESARHAAQLEQALTAWDQGNVLEAERILGTVAEPFLGTWEQRHLTALCERKAAGYRLKWELGLSGGFNAGLTRFVGGGHDHTVGVWDLASGKSLLDREGHDDWVLAVALSPDDKRFASASADGTVKVWDAESGKLVHTLDAHSDRAEQVVFSGDGRRVVWGGGAAVQVWDAATGKDLLTLPHPHHISAVAISGDGRRIVAGTNGVNTLRQRERGVVKVWDAGTGELQRTLTGHKAFTYGASFSADGRRVVSGSRDEAKLGEAKVWDALTGEELLTLRGHASWVHSAGFSPDGSRVVTGSADTTLKVWDATTGRELTTLTGHTEEVNALAVSIDGRHVVSTSYGMARPGEVIVWDLVAGQRKWLLEGHSDKVTGVAFSGDGRRVVTCGDDATVKLWDAATGLEKLTLKGHPEQIRGVAVDAVGRTIVSRGADETVRVWTAP